MPPCQARGGGLCRLERPVRVTEVVLEVLEDPRQAADAGGLVGRGAAGDLEDLAAGFRNDRDPLRVGAWRFVRGTLDRRRLSHQRARWFDGYGVPRQAGD